MCTVTLLVAAERGWKFCYFVLALQPVRTSLLPVVTFKTLSKSRFGCASALSLSTSPRPRVSSASAVTFSPQPPADHPSEKALKTQLFLSLFVSQSRKNLQALLKFLQRRFSGNTKARLLWRSQEKGETSLNSLCKVLLRQDWGLLNLKGSAKTLQQDPARSEVCFPCLWKIEKTRHLLVLRGSPVSSVGRASDF